MLLTATPAQAITFGQPDGDQHPNVGSLVIVIDGQPLQGCSGTLISPTVFLTAAHCVYYLGQFGIGNDQIFVSFDSVLDGAAVLRHGVPTWHPEYGHDMANSYDMAVIVLDEPVTDVTPAQLPTAGLLDGMDLRDQLFTAVGYGAVRDSKEMAWQVVYGEQPPQRRWVEQGFRTLTPAWLHLSQNPATGDGGTCYGDSGGPHFLGDTDTVVSLTVTGDRWCRASDVSYRIDTPWALDFLGGFVSLP